jgi:hypothetical protein
MDADEFREDFGELVALLRAGKIHPVVAERLPLAQARRATRGDRPGRPSLLATRAASPGSRPVA